MPRLQQIPPSSSLDLIIKIFTSNLCIKFIKRIHTKLDIKLKHIREKVSNQIIRLATVQEHKLDMTSGKKNRNHLMVDFINSFQIHLVVDKGIFVYKVEGGVQDKVVLACDGVRCLVEGCGEFCGVEGFIAPDD